MTVKLKISDDLMLPLDAVTQALGFLGRRGSGKSYAATKLAELFHKHGAQFVAIDPVGIWWGLRLASDGKGDGIKDLPIFGGLHGDIPLEATGGAMIADVVIDRGLSAVLDVSQFESEADKARFSRDFAARFFHRKKSNPSAVHLFIEEAQEFIPQNIQRGEEQMLHAFQRMIRLGRNFGIGVSMLSQRPQDVNKKALNQTECLFCFQLTGPQERKAVEDWVSDKGLDDDLSSILPSLKQGHAHVWSPVWLDVNREVLIAEKWTFSAGTTPKVGQRPAATKPLAPLELEKLRQDMAATIEKAKASDPALLKKRVAELERQLATKPAAPPKVVEKLAVSDKQVKEVQDVTARLEAEGKLRIESAEALRQSGQILIQTAQQFTAALSQAKNLPLPVAARVSIASRIEIPRRTTVERRPESNGEGELPMGELKILKAAAQYADGALRNQLTVLTGYKRSTRDAYIDRLRKRGFADERGGMILATDEGVAALGENFQPLPTGSELREHWLSRLPEGERKILEVLIPNWPQAVRREDLEEPTGYKRSTRDAYIQRLQAKRLVNDVGRGEVKASDDLFDAVQP